MGLFLVTSTVQCNNIIMSCLCWCMYIQCVLTGYEVWWSGDLFFISTGGSATTGSAAGSLVLVMAS